MEKLNIEVTTKEKELIIRQGNAIPHHDPQLVKLSGTITAPADFVESREENIDTDTTHVIADYTKRTITLRAGERKPWGYIVTGVLEVHPELQSFGLNSRTLYTHKSLYDMLKFKGAFFPSRDLHTAFLKKLRTFEGTVNQTFKDQNDLKGTIAVQRVVEIKTNLDLSFEVSLPLFGGDEHKINIPVEVCVDYVDGAVRFWLESTDLYEALVIQTEEVFKTELDRLKMFATVKQYN